MPGYRWTQPDIDYLSDLVGDYSLTWIHRDFNRWAARNNRPQRSKVAIQKAIWFKLRQSTVPCGEWLSTWDVGKLTDRCQEAIWLWIDKGYICRDHRRYDGNGYLICRRGLRQLARDRPDLLKHLSQERLFQLLEDETVVQHVLNAPCQPRRLTVPVRCLETGETFRSVKAAARAINCYPNTVKMAIIRGGTAKGYHFQEAA